jgi:hypothetical protein
LSNYYVLDASAVLDFLEDGPGAERIIQLVRDARDGSDVARNLRKPGWPTLRDFPSRWFP